MSQHSPNAGQIDLSGNGTASVLSGQAVSGGFFPLLGVRAAAGRLIAPSDDSVSAQPVVVLSYGYWKRQFGASPSAIEKTVRLNNVPFTIIGVADPPSSTALSPEGASYDRVNSAFRCAADQSEAAGKSSRDGCLQLVAVSHQVGGSQGSANCKAQAAMATVNRKDMLHAAINSRCSKPEDDRGVDALVHRAGRTDRLND